MHVAFKYDNLPFCQDLLLIHATRQAENEKYLTHINYQSVNILYVYKLMSHVFFISSN